MNYAHILTISRIFLLTIGCLSAIQAQTQNLRAATASSYLERGREWYAKGEYARAEVLEPLKCCLAKSECITPLPQICAASLGPPGLG